MNYVCAATGTYQMMYQKPMYLLGLRNRLKALVFLTWRKPYTFLRLKVAITWCLQLCFWKWLPLLGIVWNFWLSLFQILDFGRCCHKGLVLSLYNQLCKFCPQVTMRFKKVKDLSCWLQAWGMHIVIKIKPGSELLQTNLKVSDKR